MWIHVPSTYSQSVVESEESSWGSTQPWMEELGRSATWKTNSVSPASLRRVWKTVPSIRRLSGLTSAPSIQNRGVAEWISSLGDSRASPTVSREASSEKMTQGNSVERSSELQPDLDTQLSFLRMSPESSDSTGTPYDPNYERWVTRLRKVSSQRQRQAHLTSESASSSWPTVTQDSATPRKKKYAQGGNPLSLEATNWPTPDASPRGNRAADLIVEGKNQVRRRGSGQQRGMDLETAIKNRPTPTGRDYKGFDPPGKQHTKSDPEMYPSIPQAPATTQDGHTCSPSCRRLNPLFAEMLMGLPPAWTDDSEPLETESFRQWQHLLSESLQGG